MIREIPLIISNIPTPSSISLIAYPELPISLCCIIKKSNESITGYNEETVQVLAVAEYVYELYQNNESEIFQRLVGILREIPFDSSNENPLFLLEVLEKKLSEISADSDFPKNETLMAVLDYVAIGLKQAIASNSNLSGFTPTLLQLLIKRMDTAEKIQMIDLIYEKCFEKK